MDGQPPQYTLISKYQLIKTIVNIPLFGFLYLLFIGQAYGTGLGAALSGNHSDIERWPDPGLVLTILISVTFVSIILLALSSYWKSQDQQIRIRISFILLTISTLISYLYIFWNSGFFFGPIRGAIDLSPGWIDRTEVMMFVAFILLITFTIADLLALYKLISRKSE